MTRTFSKIYVLAALRLGWAYCPIEVAGVFHRVRGPFNINAAAQAAGLAALRDTKHTQEARAHNDHWLPWVAGEFDRLDLKYIPSVGNFLAIEFGIDGTHSAEAAQEFLRKKGILPRGIAGYGLSGHLRFTIGLENENRIIIETLEQYSKSHKIFSLI